ncbi:hypothetical protein [Streptomyces sp. NPDC051546]|uniref:hypothetical protein n=1 Tax=Streptomyces sp. NPDC051546 TaxID=3365655 RepID=UPI0037A12CBE
MPGLPDEEYQLRNQAADDVARHKFVEDIVRPEKFCNQPHQDGLALLVTNFPGLWTAPKSGSRPTRDRQFRIHEGRTLTGTLLWAEGTYADNTRHLRGRYDLTWRPYSELPGPGGTFRCLAVPVTTTGSRPVPAEAGSGQAGM